MERTTNWKVPFGVLGIYEKESGGAKWKDRDKKNNDRKRRNKTEKQNKRTGKIKAMAIIVRRVFLLPFELSKVSL